MALVCVELEEPSESRELALPPWEANRYGPISWWSMLEFSAQMFFWSAYTLRSIRADCLLGALTVPGDQPIFNPAKRLDDRAMTKALTSLVHVEKQFHDLGMRITAETVHDAIESLKKDSPRENFQWLMDQVEAIERLAIKEMQGKAFFYVPAERVKFFPVQNEPHVFGSTVAQAFGSAIYDISEAGTCLALARGSACVFHLMRVLEIGLTALGKKFGVSLAHTNWAPAIEEIESKIREMHKDPAWKAQPDCKEQQEFFAQVASHFGILKDAWRNYTMHVRGKYTEEEAENIFKNVKGFMTKLAEKGLSE